ncbi:MULTISPECIES: hypothetical protein [Dactylosporangium]|nr:MULTISPECIES: hypothetical protein [Dactylosporangium]UAB97030.1 hypothetical protein Dvina_02105 [Dactylosporangium vinaceum]UWZ45319.1 hypothetical protein Dmats_01830 [Dactylosporangium matsuzakiense]
MDRDVTRHDEINPQFARDSVVPKRDPNRLERAAELPIRRHRRREYPQPDEA